jgi:hypothetical protein
MGIIHRYNNHRISCEIDMLLNKKINKDCNFKFIKLEKTLFFKLFDKTKFIMISTEEQEFVYACKDYSKSLKIYGNNIIKLEKGCKMHFRDFEIYSPHLEINSEIIQINENFTITNENISEINRETLEIHKIDISPKLIDDKILNGFEKFKDQKELNLTVESWAKENVFLIVLTIIAIIYLFCKLTKFWNEKKKVIKFIKKKSEKTIDKIVVENNNKEIPDLSDSDESGK